MLDCGFPASPNRILDQFMANWYGKNPPPTKCTLENKHHIKSCPQPVDSLTFSLIPHLPEASGRSFDATCVPWQPGVKRPGTWDRMSIVGRSIPKARAKC